MLPFTWFNLLGNVVIPMWSLRVRFLEVSWWNFIGGPIHISVTSLVTSKVWLSLAEIAAKNCHHTNEKMKTTQHTTQACGHQAHAHRHGIAATHKGYPANTPPCGRSERPNPWKSDIICILGHLIISAIICLGWCLLEEPDSDPPALVGLCKRLRLRCQTHRDN